MKRRLNWRAATPDIIVSILFYPLFLYVIVLDPPLWLLESRKLEMFYVLVAVAPVVLLYSIVQKLRGK